MYICMYICVCVLSSETAVKKISPHSCLVGTEDGVNEVVFLDHNGYGHF